jgi:hypothetical protein
MFTKRPLVFCAIGAIVALVMACGDDNVLNPENRSNGNSVDTTAPASVTGLAAKSPTRRSLALQWVAPGDDGNDGQAQRYDIRFSKTLITEANWNSATPVDGVPTPKPAGDIEILVVKQLSAGTDYYFALKSYDEVPNESALSNCTHAVTLVENTPPATVTDLRAEAISNTEFLLTWTAPGDDNDIGTATEYDVRYSASTIGEQEWPDATPASGEPAPSQAGDREQFVIGGLRAGGNFFFALKTADEVPNWSEMSNRTVGLAFTEYLMIDPSLIARDQMTEDMTIYFRSTSPSERVKVIVTNQRYVNNEVVDVVVRHLLDGSYPAGTHLTTWDWLNDQGENFSWHYGSVKIKLYMNDSFVAYKTCRLDF